MIIKITEIPASELDSHISSMDKATREWTNQAARGECGWICSDCCMSDPKGMPDACLCDDARCSEIIKRDKHLAMQAGNEKF